MRLLSNRDDVVSVELKDGRVILVKEEELVIIDKENSPKKTKVGYTDAIIMSCALKAIFADVFEELRNLRNQPTTLNIKADEVCMKLHHFPFTPKKPES